jgi:hydrogenase-4 component E
MSSAYTQVLYAACGVLVLSGIGVVWRRELSALVHLLALQGAALALIAAVQAAHTASVELAVVAVVVATVKAVILPRALRRVLVHDDQPREAAPLVNVTASLLAAGALTLAAYAAARPLVDLNPTPAGQAASAALAVILIGFFALVARRRALSQIVAVLMVDNGIAALAFLIAAGVPLIVELGVTADVLLAVLVLQVLTARMHTHLGGTDLDDLRELRD